MVGGCWPTLMLDELENSIRMPINGLGNLAGLLGGLHKTHLEVEFEIFLMLSISNRHFNQIIFSSPHFNSGIDHFILLK